MADNASKDKNFVNSLLGTSSSDGVSTVTIWANPVTHRLLVDLGGGIFPSSLTLEIPTGTVNGVNTVFTVANNPIFEEVSGQLMVSQTQDGTNFGYTISGSGPYTITFANAPTQTPHSFYSASSAGGSLATFFQTDTFTSTNGQTVFTTSLTPAFVFSFIVNDQPQTLTQDYTQSGSTFTLNSGIPANLKVTITYLHS